MEKNKKTQKNYCQKIVYNNYIKTQDGNNTPNIIFGIILKQDQNFTTIQTARKQHIIGNSQIISIEQTTKEFIPQPPENEENPT